MSIFVSNINPSKPEGYFQAEFTEKFDIAATVSLKTAYKTGQPHLELTLSSDATDEQVRAAINKLNFSSGEFAAPDGFLRASRFIRRPNPEINFYMSKVSNTDLTERDIYEFASKYGEVHRLKFFGPSGDSKLGSCLLQFYQLDEEVAQQLIGSSGEVFDAFRAKFGEGLYIDRYRAPAERRNNFTNVWFGNISPDCDEAAFVELLGKVLGTADFVRSIIFSDVTDVGERKVRHAIVNFLTHELANRAIAELHGYEMKAESGDYILRADVYKSSDQRQTEKAAQQEKKSRELRQRYLDCNVRFHNLPEWISEDEFLTAIGKENIVRHRFSNDTAYVLFTTPVLAREAMDRFHGQVVASVFPKPEGYAEEEQTGEEPTPEPQLKVFVVRSRVEQPPVPSDEGERETRGNYAYPLVQAACSDVPELAALAAQAVSEEQTFDDVVALCTGMLIDSDWPSYEEFKATCDDRDCFNKLVADAIKATMSN